MIGLVQVCVLALVAVASAFPQAPTKQIEILNQQSEGPNPDGSYRFSYDTENGIHGEEAGQPVSDGSDVVGSYTYTSPDGTPIKLTYVANQGGYQPQGEHLPTSPPIPEAIQRALEYIAAHPPPPEGSEPARRY